MHIMFVKVRCNEKKEVVVDKMSNLPVFEFFWLCKNSFLQIEEWNIFGWLWKVEKSKKYINREKKFFAKPRLIERERWNTVGSKNEQVIHRIFDIYN